MEAFMYRLIVRHFCNVYNKLVAVETPTKSAAELLRRVNLSKPTYIISHGVDLKRFNPKNNSGIVKKRYRIPNKPIMLYVGRIDKEKRIDSIVKSMPLILKEIDVHLVIAGCGAETQNLRNLVKNLGINKNITFTGFVPDNYLPNLYCIADCFVIASIAELQSFVTMEAMASGLPVIAAKAMALPELVQHGKNGYLFKPNDIKSITKYSVEILSNKNLRIKMSKKSLEIIQKHKVEKTIDQFELLYKSLKK